MKVIINIVDGLSVQAIAEVLGSKWNVEATYINASCDLITISGTGRTLIDAKGKFVTNFLKKHNELPSQRAKGVIANED